MRLQLGEVRSAVEPAHRRDSARTTFDIICWGEYLGGNLPRLAFRQRRGSARRAAAASNAETAVVIDKHGNAMQQASLFRDVERWPD